MNPEFRSSPMSRRTLWKWLPIFAGMFILADVMTGCIWAPAVFYADLSFLVLSIAVAMMPTVALWSDAFLTIGLVGMNVGPPNQLSHAEVVAPIFSILCLFILFVMGIHSSMLLSGAAALWIVFVTNGNVDSSSAIGYYMACAVFLILAGSLVCEATTAYYFGLLEQNISENERLLNDATVSCTINRVTGRISKCSNQASSLLGLNPNGGCIFESVQSRERAVFCSFCAQGVDGALPDPILVTMNHKLSWDSAPAGECDMKVVQYSSAHADDVRLLFELTGEMRINIPSVTADRCESQAGFKRGANQPAADMANSMGTLDKDSLCFSLSQDTGLLPSPAAAASFVEKCDIGTQTASLPPAIPNTQGSAQATGRRLKFRAPLIGNVKLKTRKLVMNQFVETPNTTIVWLVIQSLLQFNPRGKGCCSLHIGLQQLLHCILDMSAKPCNPSHQPNCGWQCRLGFALHEEEEQEEEEDDVHLCTVCFSESVVEEHAQPAQQLQDASSSCLADGESTPSAGSNLSSASD